MVDFLEAGEKGGLLFFGEGATEFHGSATGDIVNDFFLAAADFFYGLYLRVFGFARGHEIFVDEVVE